MTDFSVTTSGELRQALGQAQSGDTIALAPGTYSNVDASGLNFAAAINVVSQDAANEAVLTDLSVIQSSGLHFANLEFSGSSASAFMPFVIANSSHIELENISFHNQTPDDFSILLTSASSDISVHNSNGAPVMMSPTVIDGEEISFVTNDPAPFAGLATWLNLGDGVGISLTNPIPADTPIPDTTPPAAIGLADSSETPIVVTGARLMAHGDMVGAEA